MSTYPILIQGGMGVGVSGWRLAQAVSKLGQLGVVSGTALDQVLARRLQDGDPGGHMQRALRQFPVPEMAQRVLDRYYIPGGKAESTPYLMAPVFSQDPPRELVELTIIANFVEVFLAREGHTNPVGINYLEKIQLPLLPSVYGAMLAGVEYVLMGAGIPLKVPGVLDKLAQHQSSSYDLNVTGATADDDFSMHFDPQEFVAGYPGPLVRPRFLAIIASNVLATTLARKANGKVDGFVVESPTAGGHNAPPRGKPILSESGEPVYGERDQVDFAKLRELGLPFWLAGGYGRPGKLQEALSLGATGIQVGTAFAYCEESGLRSDYKQALLQKAVAGGARIFTDPLASPTGFPFKVAQLKGTLSEADVYAARPRICDLGFLREAYRTEDGRIGFRCPGEPATVYVSKGGPLEKTVGRKCLCNALVANIGHPQRRNGNRIEAGLVTSGDDLTLIPEFLAGGRTSYSAEEVVKKLMGI